MFYGITTQRFSATVLTAACLVSTLYAGKDHVSDHQRTARHQTVHRQTCFYRKKEHAQSELYEAVRQNDIQKTASILSSAPVDINKQYGFWRNTLLHRTVIEKRRKLTALLLKHPTTNPALKNISAKGGRTALDIAVEFGSHSMIKTFTRQKNFDPTCRDEHGKSTINKLAERKRSWAENLCRYHLKNSLKQEEQQIKKAKKKKATEHTPTSMQCMVCLQTPQEILTAAATHPLDADKKPEQLMSITACCHKLVCADDKQQWLDVYLQKTCPNCREPLL